MKHIFSHILFALRLIAKTPVISVLSILVLAFGIAGVGSIFNILEAIMLRDLPYDHPDRLMTVYRADPRTPDDPQTWPATDYRELRTQAKSAESVNGIIMTQHVVDFGNEKVLQADGTYLEWDFLQMLGREPELGRKFTEADAAADAEPVTIICHQDWLEHFGQDPGVIGKTIKVDGRLRTIVGVMPEGFDYPFVHNMWSPLNLDTLEEVMGWNPDVFVIMKRKAAVTVAQAEADVGAILARLETTYPDRNKGVTLPVLRDFKSEFNNSETKMLFAAVFGCSLLVLLMACGIVANLVTAQVARRTQELAIRGALGATRGQIVAQMLTECMIIAILGLVVGIVLRNWFEIGVLTAYYQEFNIPHWMSIRQSSMWHVGLVAAVLVIATLASGLMPALRATRGDLNALLHDSSRTGSSLRLSFMGKFLIIWQIATACAILTGGGIIVYMLQKARDQHSYYDTDQFLYAHVAIKAGKYPDWQSRPLFFEKLLQRLENEPGVKTAVLTTENMYSYIRKPIEIDGRTYATPGDRPTAYERVVSRQYFSRLGIPILSGREFDGTEDPDGVRVAVVCEPFARVHWGDENPVGKRFRYGGRDDWLTVIGVVPELFDGVFVRDHVSGYFLPEAQEAWMDQGVQVAGYGNPMDLEQTVRRIVGDLDAEASITDVNTVTNVQEASLIFFRFMLTIFMVFAAGSLVMAAAGLFAVITFAASQRRREIGIRMALGANPLSVTLMLFRQGLVNIGIGLVFGVAGALLIRAALQNVFDPFYESVTIYGIFLFALLTVAMVAIWMPSFLGARTEPAEALRID